MFDTDLNGYTKSVETCFVFCGIVGSWKMNSEDVSELVLSRSNKQNVSASTVDVEGAIENTLSSARGKQRGWALGS